MLHKTIFETTELLVGPWLSRVSGTMLFQTMMPKFSPGEVIQIDTITGEKVRTMKPPADYSTFTNVEIAPDGTIYTIVAKLERNMHRLAAYSRGRNSNRKPVEFALAACRPGEDAFEIVTKLPDSVYISPFQNVISSTKDHLYITASAPRFLFGKRINHHHRHSAVYRLPIN